jgi:hypothetical protein
MKYKMIDISSSEENGASREKEKINIDFSFIYLVLLGLMKFYWRYRWLNERI